MRIKTLVLTLTTVGATYLGANAQTSPTQIPDTLSLSLDKCIEIALSTNPTIKVSDMEIERVDYSRKEMLGQLLPTVTFGGSYNRTLAKQVAYMNMSKFPGLGNLGGGEGEGEEAQPQSKGSGDTGIKMGLDNSFSLGFQASLPLIAPQLWESLKLSDSQILQSYETARKSRLSMVNAVKNAYYALMLANDSRRVIQESYDMAALNHRIYSDKYALGAASDYDVLRTSVAMKNIEPQIIQADIAINRANLQLQLLMGLDTHKAIKPTQQLQQYQADMYEQALNLTNDINNNSDIVMMGLQTKTLEHALKVQKMAWYPTLALSGNYNWMSSSDGSPFKNFRWTPYSMVGLTLNIPLYQGGQRYNRIRQAQIQLDEMAYQRQNLVQSVSNQVRLAIDNINMNVKQIASADESVKQAVRAHDIMQQSFAIGAASYLDLRDSELSLTQAQLAYYQSIYNYLVSRAELELLQGNAPIQQYDPTYSSRK